MSPIGEGITLRALSELQSMPGMPRARLLLIGLIGLFGLSCASASGQRTRASPPDPLSRIETLSRILVLEDRRSLGGGALPGFLENEDPSVRRRAAIAAGRIGDPLAVQGLIARLQDPVFEVRRAAAFALGLLGKPESVSALKAALADPDPVTRGRAAEALSRIGDSSAAALIAESFRKALPRGSDGVLRIRGDDPGRDDDPWIELRLHLVALARLGNGQALATALLSEDSAPVVDWWAAVWAAMRIADPRLEPVLRAGASAEDPYIRSLAAKGLGALKAPGLLSVLRKLAEDRESVVVVEALRALVQLQSREAAAMVAPFVDSPSLTLRREALVALGALPPESRFRPRVIENVGHPVPWIRSAAWPALVKIDAAEVGLVLSTVGPDPEWTVRAALAGALGEMGERAAPLLMRMLGDPDVRVVQSALAAIAHARGPDAIPTLADHVTHPDMGVRATAVSSLAQTEGVDEKRLIPWLAAAFDASLGDRDIEARMTVVEALEKNGSADARGFLRRIAGSDASRAVRQRSLSALKEGFAPPEDNAIRTPEARRLVSVYQTGEAPIYSPRAVISTRYGRIELALDLVDTPLTTMSFVRLAESGFFNGLTFHRVIPGFLIQGGDPRGDGYGGPGSTIRCEYNSHAYGRGAVGMALAGKDSGGSQFFITTTPQPNLDGAYTLFGRVLAGMDVVDRIRPGDVIDRLEIFEGRESR